MSRPDASRHNFSSGVMGHRIDRMLHRSECPWYLRSAQSGGSQAAAAAGGATNNRPSELSCFFPLFYFDIRSPPPGHRDTLECVGVRLVQCIVTWVSSPQARGPLCLPQLPSVLRTHAATPVRESWRNLGTLQQWWAWACGHTIQRMVHHNHLHTAHGIFPNRKPR